jgi:hypothetical protein
LYAAYISLHLASYRQLRVVCLQQHKSSIHGTWASFQPVNKTLLVKTPGFVIGGDHHTPHRGSLSPPGEIIILPTLRGSLSPPRENTYSPPGESFPTGGVFPHRGRPNGIPLSPKGESFPPKGRSKNGIKLPPKGEPSPPRGETEKTGLHSHPRESHSHPGEDQTGILTLTQGRVVLHQGETHDKNSYKTLRSQISNITEVREGRKEGTDKEPMRSWRARPTTGAHLLKGPKVQKAPRHKSTSV